MVESPMKVKSTIAAILLLMLVVLAGYGVYRTIPTPSKATYLTIVYGYVIPGALNVTNIAYNDTWTALNNQYKLQNDTLVRQSSGFYSFDLPPGTYVVKYLCGNGVIWTIQQHVSVFPPVGSRGYMQIDIVVNAC
jgi:uncharacterized membrane protein